MWTMGKGRSPRFCFSHVKANIFLILWMQLYQSLPISCENDAVYGTQGYQYQILSPEMRYPQLRNFRNQNQHVNHALNPQALPGGVSTLGKLKLDHARGSGSVEEDANAYGEQQLLPPESLHPKQFPKSFNSMMINQANGAFMEREPSEESRTAYNPELDVDGYPPRPPVFRQRVASFSPMGLGGPPVKRSQSLSAAREGYMCHFKVCHWPMSVSGKRRWSPLFAFD